MVKFSWHYGLKISWLQKPFQKFPFTLFSHCCQLLTTPHEQLFIFQKMSASVDTVPTWLTKTKLLIITHRVHVNKYELLVEGIEITWTSIPAMLIYGSAVGEIIMTSSSCEWENEQLEDWQMQARHSCIYKHLMSQLKSYHCVYCCFENQY